MKNLFSVLALVALTACGASASPAPSVVARAASTLPPRIIATTAATGPTTFNYTETSVFGPSWFTLPSGFNPPCPSNSLVIWSYQYYGAPTLAPFSLVWHTTTGSDGTVLPDPIQPNVGLCHANYGDSITATLTVNYGAITLLGNSDLYRLWDTKPDDSGGTTALLLNSTSAGAGTRNWAAATNFTASGDFLLRQSTARLGNPIAAGATKFYIDPNGNVGLGGRTTALGAVLDVLGGGLFSTTVVATNHISNAAAASGGAGTVSYGGTTASTVGAAGGASALPATPLGYILINVAGTAARIPYYN